VLIRNVDEAEAFDFGQVANRDVVIWNLQPVHPRDRGAVFAALKDRLTAYLLATRGRHAALVIDEAAIVTRQKAGEDTLYDAATRGRHYGVELHTLTQLATTSFNSEIGRGAGYEREPVGTANSRSASATSWSRTASHSAETNWT